jgi:hypothetical protein
MIGVFFLRAELPPHKRPSHGPTRVRQDRQAATTPGGDGSSS